MLGTEGTDNQICKGHTGVLRQCQLYIQRAQTITQTGAHWGTVYSTNRGHWQPAREGRGWAHRAQITKQTRSTHTGVLSTMHTEGTANQRFILTQ